MPAESCNDVDAAVVAARGGNITFAVSIMTSAAGPVGRPPTPATPAAAAGDILLDVDNVNAARSAALSADAKITTSFISEENAKQLHLQCSSHLELSIPQHHWQRKCYSTHFQEVTENVLLQ